MTSEEAKALIEKNLPGKTRDMKTDVRRLFLTVDPQDFLSACHILKKRLGVNHVSTVTGRDATTHFDVIYHFALGGLVISVRVIVSRQDPVMPSSTDFFPGATLYEREVYDILGVQFDGHQDLRRLVLPDDWPVGVHPLRKDWQFDRETGVIK